MKKVLHFEKKSAQSPEIKLRDISIGGSDFVVMAGPCSVENKEQLLTTARYVQKTGIRFLRGGAFKPRTSPYSFQGLEEKGIEILNEAKRKYNLMVITELMDINDLHMVEDCADIIQIGSRNMHNYSLLKALGKTQRPILLKRGYAATIEEWILAAEYISYYGNPNVILCERGIRTFETATRFTLDLGAVAFVKKFTDYPVIVDPSHASGMRELVAPMSKAALIAGADGILVEIHPNPEEALSDGQQSLTFDDFTELMLGLEPICRIANKRLT